VRLPGFLTPTQCAELFLLWDDPTRFRKEVDMTRHGYGDGVYRYFADPLPKAVDALRRDFYAALAPTANQWCERLAQTDRFPETFEEFQALCEDAGQAKPTPLMLDYGPGGYNRLHQDRYGERAFPFQLVLMLSRPVTGDEVVGSAGTGEFSGGEFLLVEQRARMQAQGTAIALRQGDALVFPTDTRPVWGVRGFVRAAVRHGVSEVIRGHRRTLGVIFHAAA
jgi:hypothetical protein